MKNLFFTFFILLWTYFGYGVNIIDKIIISNDTIFFKDERGLIISYKKNNDYYSNLVIGTYKDTIPKWNDNFCLFKGNIVAFKIANYHDNILGNNQLFQYVKTNSSQEVSFTEGKGKNFQLPKALNFSVFDIQKINFHYDLLISPKRKLQLIIFYGGVLNIFELVNDSLTNPKWKLTTSSCFTNSIKNFRAWYDTNEKLNIQSSNNSSYRLDNNSFIENNLPDKSSSKTLVYNVQQGSYRFVNQISIPTFDPSPETLNEIVKKIE